MEAAPSPMARVEVRTFLRDFSGANVVLYGGLGVLALGGAFIAAGAIPRSATNLVVAIGAGAMFISAVSLGGGIMALRRERVPWTEVDRAIDRESADLL